MWLLLHRGRLEPKEDTLLDGTLLTSVVTDGLAFIYLFIHFEILRSIVAKLIWQSSG